MIEGDRLFTVILILLVPILTEILTDFLEKYYYKHQDDDDYKYDAIWMLSKCYVKLLDKIYQYGNPELENTNHKEDTKQ
ncbi:MAG: hypothetical protein LUD48_03205 [Prevotella sp.]|nr:hypothetical protein [Prevotella sp.]